MLYLRRVVGHSMQPRLKPGRLVLFRRARRPGVGDIVLVEWGGREVVKRVAAITPEGLRLVGDNPADSLDSRQQGLLDPKSLRGKLLLAR